MNRSKAVFYLLIATTLLTHDAHGRSKKRRPVDNTSVRQELANAGIRVDDRRYESCARDGDRARTTLNRKPKYLAVMLKSFARSVCRPRNDLSKVAMLYGSPGRDALGNGSFPAAFAQLKRGSKSANLSPMAAARSPASSGESSALINTYALLFGLGLRESSGDFNEGEDHSAKRGRGSHEIEAGVFQTSFNIHGCMKGGAKNALTGLENSYAGASSHDCMSSSGRDVPNASHNASSFQTALKSCPALAVEHAAITIRHCRHHYGPLVRGETKTFNSCKPLLSEIAAQVSANPGLCDNLQLGAAFTPNRQVASVEAGR